MTELPHTGSQDPAPFSPAEARGETAGAGTPRRRPRALPTVVAAIACFGVAFEFLAFQLFAGNDPALGGSAKAPAPVSQPVQKRIVVTRVVGSGGSASSSAGSSSAPAASSAPAPVVTASS